MITNVLLGLFKLLVGAIASSMAVLVDGLQSLTCAAVGGLVVAGMRIARRPGDRRFPYGYGKVEVLVALVSNAALLGLALFILGSSIYLLVVGRSAPPRPIALPMALISILGNYLMFRVCQCAGRSAGSAGLMANAVQNRADMLSSCAVAVSVALCFLGPSWYFADALGAAVTALMILFEAMSSWCADMSSLLDRDLPHSLLRRAEQITCSVGSVRGTLFIRGCRRGRAVALQIGIKVSPEASIQEVDRVSVATRTAVMVALPSVQEVSVLAYSAGR